MAKSKPDVRLSRSDCEEKIGRAVQDAKKAGSAVARCGAEGAM